MKGYAMLKIGESGWIEKDRPVCGPMDAICKPLAVAICTSDVHTLWEGAIGDRHNMILGHECCAEVVEVGSMVGYEQSETKGNYLQAYRGDYVSISIPEIFAGSSDKNKQSNDGSSSQTARQNIFGRLSYDYAGKYLAQFTFRRDGSPNFPENKRYGFFPGFSLGWRISEEPFMKNLPVSLILPSIALT